jgi:hypothetical protein
MTTLKTKSDNQTTITKTAPAVEQSTNAALITEQQVLFASAQALAPAPARRRSVVSAVRAMFVRPEKTPHPPKHYPQRFAYLENSLMSREMYRL